MMRILLIIGLFYYLFLMSFCPPETQNLKADVVPLNYLKDTKSNLSLSFIRVTHFKVIKSIPLSHVDFVHLKKISVGKTVISKEFGRTTFTKKLISPICMKRKVIESKKYIETLKVLKKYE